MFCVFYHFAAGKNKNFYVHSICLDEISKTVEEIFEKYSFLKFLERFSDIFLSFLRLSLTNMVKESKLDFLVCIFGKLN